MLECVQGVRMGKRKGILGALSTIVRFGVAGAWRC